MKITIPIISLLIVLASCGFFEKDKDKFVDTYKDILIERAKEPDSIKANNEVKKIIEKHGYNEKTFRDAFFGYARNSKEFLVLVDSARIRAERELTGTPEVKKK